MSELHQGKPTHPLMGIALLLFSKKRYLKAAIDHAIWTTFRIEGRPPLDLEKTKQNEIDRFLALRQLVRRSFSIMALAVLGILLLGAALNIIALKLPLDMPKGLTVLGTALLCWAGLLELTHPIKSYGGATLSEITYRAIFRINLIVGSIVLMATIFG